MNNVRKKFVWTAMLSLFALLTVMLSIINGVNFTMAADDADLITENLSNMHGSFAGVAGKEIPKRKNEAPSTDDTPEDNALKWNIENKSGNMGPMGPQSPEINFSTRYFTYVFNPDGNIGRIAFKISAVEQKEAQEWARSLLDNASPVGWTHGTYRYRVYTEGKRTFVTVIDQGRELLPSYRILIISVCGEIFGLLVSYFILKIVSGRIFAPLEEANRKQKQFLANIENEFKLPLTVISADTELIEKETGSSDYTKSINRQLKKMTALVRDIGSLVLYEEHENKTSTVNLSSTFCYAIDNIKAEFKEKQIELEMNIEDDITIDGEDEAIHKLCVELVDNALKYALTKASFTLKTEHDRILLIQSNDTKLPSGTVDQVFDRFTVLENASDSAIGLGLSYVKDIAKDHNGRVSAKVNDGMFILKIAL